jgi:hypothetical protein
MKTRPAFYLFVFFALIALRGCGSIPVKVLSDTIYVSPSGSDRNSGFYEAEAFRSLFKALAVASRSPVKTIVVLGTLDIASEQSANSERIFLIQGSGKEQITIRGKAGENAALSGQGARRRVVLLRDVCNIRFEDIEISGGECWTESGGGGIGIGEGAVVTLGPGALVRGNQSASLGGGVVVAPGGVLKISGGSVLNNNAQGVGGGVAAVGKGAELVMNGGEIRGNRAEGGGGVAAYEGCSVFLNSGLIVNNEAGTAGGGLVLNSGADFTMTGGAVRDNRSSGSGGGLALLNDAAFTLLDGEIGGNTGAEYGGGLSVDGSSRFYLEGGTIRDNSAGRQGGGVFSLGVFSKISESNCVIYGRNDPENANNAPEGSAVYVSRGGLGDMRRETSAGEGVILDTGVYGAEGGWENAR